MGQQHNQQILERDYPNPELDQLGLVEVGNTWRGFRFLRTVRLRASIVVACRTGLEASFRSIVRVWLLAWHDEGFRK
jgi:hypothetical protein